VVEHLTRDPEVVALTEEPKPAPVQEGPCLFCGLWLDPDAESVYALVVSKIGGDASEYVCHIACLASAAHSTVRLPV
jgi:hypothetical protein